MKGDFTRVTERAAVAHHVRRVLRQQGRVDLDADWNEQASTILHQLRAAMRDLVGPYAAPDPEASEGRDGFRVVAAAGEEFDVRVQAGHYWVDGLLCENDDEDGVLLSAQPDLHVPRKPGRGRYVLYLDVWERHLCAEEAPWIVEVALGGPDTSSRSTLVWQLKMLPVPPRAAEVTPASIRKNWPETRLQFQPRRRGTLQARAVALPGATDPCVMPPDSRYRGPENQLYRVEIHGDGPAGATATFKWSRDNGSIVYPIRRLAGTEVELERLPLDPRRTLQPGDWVEVVDDHVTQVGDAGPMAEVKRVDHDELTVELIPPAAGGFPSYDAQSTTHPYLRRWDQHGPPVAVEENAWLDLEDGVQVRFDAPEVAGNDAPAYRTGDFWVIPARVATGDVEWPQGPAGALAVPPHGVDHSYAPLALVTFAADGAATVVDLRRRIVQGWKDL